MTSPSARAPRRLDALSRERIVAAAIEILDAGGEQALTVRALTDRLSTGRGAIYHHVSGVDDVLAAATDDIVTAALAHPSDDDADTAIRHVSLGLFDAIDAHPWVGAQLARDPSQPAVLRIWTSIGTRLRELGVVGQARAEAGATLTNYIFGAAAQFGAGARRTRDAAERQRRLYEVAQAWIALNPDVGDAAAHLRDHDDRGQFLAGIDIILRGIVAVAGR